MDDCTFPLRLKAPASGGLNFACCGDQPRRKMSFPSIASSRKGSLLWLPPSGSCPTALSPKFHLVAHLDQKLDNTVNAISDLFDFLKSPSGEPFLEKTAPDVTVENSSAETLSVSVSPDVVNEDYLSLLEREAAVIKDELRIMSSQQQRTTVTSPQTGVVSDRASVYSDRHDTSTPLRRRDSSDEDAVAAVLTASEPLHNPVEVEASLYLSPTAAYPKSSNPDSAGGASFVTPHIETLRRISICSTDEGPMMGCVQFNCCCDDPVNCLHFHPQGGSPGVSRLDSTSKVLSFPVHISTDDPLSNPLAAQSKRTETAEFAMRSSIPPQPFEI